MGFADIIESSTDSDRGRLRSILLWVEGYSIGNLTARIQVRMV